MVQTATRTVGVCDYQAVTSAVLPIPALALPVPPQGQGSVSRPPLGVTGGTCCCGITGIALWGRSADHGASPGAKHVRTWSSVSVHCDVSILGALCADAHNASKQKLTENIVFTSCPLRSRAPLTLPELLHRSHHPAGDPVMTRWPHPALPWLANTISGPYSAMPGLGLAVGTTDHLRAWNSTRR